MRRDVLHKKIRSKVFLLQIFLKRFIKAKPKAKYKNLNDFGGLLSTKDKISVVCSGPSAKKLKVDEDALYLVTNDSYKLVSHQDFIYYVNDGYFFRKFLANAPFCKNHYYNVFFYRKEDQLHKNSFQYFKKNSPLIENENFLISNFKNDFKYSEFNYHTFIDFLSEHNIPIKFQNSGIFLLLFGFYLAETYHKKLEIYGLDLGVGGHTHFDKKGHVGKSITRDRVKVNTQQQLNLIYKNLGHNVKNYSFFNSNIE